MHFLLFYEVVDNYAERRAPLRAQHLALAWRAVDAGELILGGAFGDPVEGVMLLFRSDSAEPAERFARSDPYVQNGLVRKWWVRRWLTVVGPDAASPVHPEST